MNNAIESKHRLADGSTVWLQRVKIPGLRKPSWSVVICPPEWMAAPEIIEVTSRLEGLEKIVELLKNDVLETL